MGLCDFQGISTFILLCWILDDDDVKVLVHTLQSTVYSVQLQIPLKILLIAKDPSEAGTVAVPLPDLLPQKGFFLPSMFCFSTL